MSITVTTYNDLQLYPYKLIDLLELKIDSTAITPVKNR